MILQDILEAANVDIHYQTGNQHEVFICCPMPNCNDERFRLGINVKTGAAHCFACEWKARGTIYTARQLCKVFNLKFNLRGQKIRERKAEVDKQKQEAVEPAYELPEEFEDFTTPLDPIGKRARVYLRSRGVSTLQIVKHGIGFAAHGTMGWRVIFPVLDRDNVLRGCVGRDFSGTQKPKYLNTPGLKLLWNAQRHAKTAVVVEGVMDALRVEKALLQMRDVVSLARLGSAITPMQLDQLKMYERVVILPDWDRAGVHGAIELSQRCDARGIETLVAIPEAMNGSDPADMEEDFIVDLIKGSVPYSRHTEHRLRLAATRETNDE